MIGDWLGEGVVAVAGAIVVAAAAIAIYLDGHSKTSSRERVRIEIVEKCFNQPNRVLCAQQLADSVSKVK